MFEDLCLMCGKPLHDDGRAYCSDECETTDAASTTSPSISSASSVFPSPYISSSDPGTDAAALDIPTLGSALGSALHAAIAAYTHSSTSTSTHENGANPTKGRVRQHYNYTQRHGFASSESSVYVDTDDDDDDGGIGFDPEMGLGLEGGALLIREAQGFVLAPAPQRTGTLTTLTGSSARTSSNASNASPYRRGPSSSSISRSDGHQHQHQHPQAHPQARTPDHDTHPTPSTSTTTPRTTGGSPHTPILKPRSFALYARRPSTTNTRATVPSLSSLIAMHTHAHAHRRGASSVSAASGSAVEGSAEEDAAAEGDVPVEVRTGRTREETVVRREREREPRRTTGTPGPQSAPMRTHAHAFARPSHTSNATSATSTSTSTTYTSDADDEDPERTFGRATAASSIASSWARKQMSMSLKGALAPASVSVDTVPAHAAGAGAGAGAACSPPPLAGGSSLGNSNGPVRSKRSRASLPAYFSLLGASGRARAGERGTAVENGNAPPSAFAPFSAIRSQPQAPPHGAPSFSPPSSTPPTMSIATTTNALTSTASPSVNAYVSARLVHVLGDAVSASTSASPPTPRVPARKVNPAVFNSSLGMGPGLGMVRGMTDSMILVRPASRTVGGGMGVGVEGTEGPVVSAPATEGVVSAFGRAFAPAAAILPSEATAASDSGSEPAPAPTPTLAAPVPSIAKREVDTSPVFQAVNRRAVGATLRSTLSVQSRGQSQSLSRSQDEAEAQAEASYQRVRRALSGEGSPVRTTVQQDLRVPELDPSAASIASASLSASLSISASASRSRRRHRYGKSDGTLTLASAVFAARGRPTVRRASSPSPGGMRGTVVGSWAEREGGRERVRVQRGRRGGMEFRGAESRSRSVSRSRSRSGTRSRDGRQRSRRGGNLDIAMPASASGPVRRGRACMKSQSRGTHSRNRSRTRSRSRSRTRSRSWDRRSEHKSRESLFTWEERRGRRMADELDAPFPGDDRGGGPGYGNGRSGIRGRSRLAVDGVAVPGAAMVGEGAGVIGFAVQMNRR